MFGKREREREKVTRQRVVKAQSKEEEEKTLVVIAHKSISRFQRNEDAR